jgi:hypothetical protein
MNFIYIAVSNCFTIKEKYIDKRFYERPNVLKYENIKKTAFLSPLSMILCCSS